MIRFNKPMGFAAMPEDRRREISKLGAMAARRQGHRGRPFTSDTGRLAGREGGKIWGAIRRQQLAANEVLDMKRYLGDGVYADFDGHFIVLTTEDGLRVTNRILMASDVFNNLERYIQHLDNRVITEPKRKPRKD